MLAWQQVHWTLICWSDVQEDSDGKNDDTIEWGDEGISLAGRLGQAYVAGYNCNTEEELQQVCGFRSFRT